MVANDEVDVGILMEEPAVSGLRSIKVANYSIALIVYSGHPLIEQAKQQDGGLNLDELTDLPLILMQRGASLRRAADILLGQAGGHQQISMELDNVEAIKKMIEARLGVSLLPIMSVRNETAAGTLVALPIHAPSPPDPSIVMVHREDKYVTGAMQAFIDLIRTHLPKTSE
jgi:DNA-binding transcriptional LysR family regulator